MDHNIPFSLTSTSGLQGEVADTTIDIQEHLDVTAVVKLVNNFDVFHFPKPQGTFLGISNDISYSYGYNLSSIKALIAPLGIPWHKNKGQELADTFAYLSFHWDLPNKTISLPDHKHKKYLLKLSSFICSCKSAQVFKPQAESIISTLSHITFIHL